MSHVLLAALLVASSTAAAQAPAGSTPPPAPATESAPASAPATSAESPAAAPAQPAAAQPPATEGEAVTRDDLEATKQELRGEIRAEAAKQSLNGEEWSEEYPEEQRKLEIFTLDGYFRLRPTLFYKFDLGRPMVPDLFPRSPRAGDRTQAFATMRLRLDPTFNVSEQVRIKLQVDGLDNMVMGSTPDTLYPGQQRNIFTIFSEDQESLGNTLSDSIKLRRAYGEVNTPVGILRFGRMGSQWGLGMLRNDGNCFDCDYGDTVDRIQFVTEPFAGWYITPMLDFNAEGAISKSEAEGEPIDLTNADDAHSWVLAIARRDTDAQIRSKLENNQGVLQYGLHFSYRTQRYQDTTEANGSLGFIPRDASLYIPDVWLRYEERNWRVEFELAAILGKIGNRALVPGDTSFNQSLDVTQFGGVVQGEMKFLDQKLSLNMELGFASGDKAPGFGNYPGRKSQLDPNSDYPTPGDVEGRQYRCDRGGCSDRDIRNFRFNRDYRVDLILWRELIGGITDAFYVRPSAKYTVAPGIDLWGRLIYSQAIYAQSTPSYVSKSLGIELNAGVDYASEDGFIAGVAYGILFPMAGLGQLNVDPKVDLATPHTVRGWLGIKF